ncbi:MAG: transglutaminase domain-containing protein, partial [Candidatus Hydrothermota bacterium]
MHFLTVPLPEEIEREEKLGNFKRAKSLIYKRLQSNLPSPLKERLEYELERIERLIKNYPYSEKKAIKRLFKTIKNFTNREYRALLEEGLLDYITVEGKRKFESRFIENLIFARPEYRKRVKPNKKREKARQILYKRIKELLDGSRPKTYTVTAEIEVTLQTEKIKGKKVRCWLP